MYKHSALLTFGAALLLSLFCVDGGYAIQIVNRPPPVDLMTVASKYGWTEGPLQVVGILLGIGIIVLIGLGVRKIRYHHGHHAHGQQT